MSVAIIGSHWFEAMPALSAGELTRYVQRLAQTLDINDLQVRAEERRQRTPTIGVVLVRVDPPGELKAYIGLASGFDREADARFVAAWGAHFPVKLAQQLIDVPTERARSNTGGQ